MSMYQRRIGKYELRGHLGSGAVGEIWKAFDTQQHCNVLIKIIQVNAQAGGDFASGFYREAQTLATLQHPNIVPILDFRISQSGSEAYLIMDYVEGQSLADYLDETAHQGKFLPPAEIVRLLTPIAAAIDYAHQHNVVHGALKPSVILLDKVNAGQPQESAVHSTPPLQPGEPKIVDFGMNHMQNPLSLPLSDVHYISPEIAQGYAVTSRSDIYSLGVILYEICTGTLPFQGDTQSDILMQHIHGAPMAPTSINPHISPALAAVIMRSLTRDPAARFSSATALVAAAARALNISTPQSSMSLSHPSLGMANPSTLSGSLPQRSQPLPTASAGDALDTMNSPTYLSPLPLRSQSLPTASAGDALDPMNSPTYLSPLPLRSQPLPTPAVSGPGATLPQQTLVQPPPLPTVVAPAKRKQPNRLFIALTAALVVVLLAAGLVTYLHYGHPSAPPQTPIAGHAFFVSSGLVSLNSNQGITDEVQINLSNIPSPQPGKSYYAWLLSNQEINLPAILLGSGSLPLNHGQITMLYINPEHDNLLANYNHFLITEESANPTPINPSLDLSAWRYSASFSTTPNPADVADHFSLYDHLRHLLAQDPKLKLAGLTGGLDIWLYRNTSKILEAAGAARDSQPDCTSAQNNAACSFVLREMVRVLDYLDGINYVSRDLPPGMTPLYIDPVIARVALLEIDPVNQQPPGYLKHMGNHLRLITTSPGATPEQRALAIRINQDINNVQGWLNAVRADAVKLVHMNNAQLSQPAALSILNDLFTQANYAFVGQFDPNTNSVKEGVVEIHYNIQRLATFDVTPCTTTNGKNSCA